MLKAVVTPTGITFHVEAPNQKEMFRAIADIQEIFAEKECGLCKKTLLRYVVRQVAGNDFPEIHCLSCGGKLAFGQSKAKPGTLFPIRKLTAAGKPDRKLGTYDNAGRGWTKYHGEKAADTGE